MALSDRPKLYKTFLEHKICKTPESEPLLMQPFAYTEPQIADTVINDLSTDLHDGLKLIALLEVLSGKKMPRHNKRPNFR